MGQKTKPRITSGATAALSGAWGWYAHITTAASLPQDAHKLEVVMADPPVYLPWVIFAISVLVLGWSLWPSDDKEDTEGEVDGGQQFNQTHSGSGDNHMTF